MGKKEKSAAIVMTEGKREIIRQLLSEYDIQTAQDIQDELKDLLGGTKSERSNSDNTRNGHIPTLPRSSRQKYLEVRGD